MAITALGLVGRVVRDRGYSSDPWRAAIRNAGAVPVVPAHPTHKAAPPRDPRPYRRRHLVENLWAKLKEWSALATRYDKTAESFLGGLHLTAALDLLSYRPYSKPYPWHRSRSGSAPRLALRRRPRAPSGREACLPRLARRRLARRRPWSARAGRSDRSRWTDVQGACRRVLVGTLASHSPTRHRLGVSKSCAAPFINLIQPVAA